MSTLPAEPLLFDHEEQELLVGHFLHGLRRRPVNLTGLRSHIRLGRQCRVPSILWGTIDWDGLMGFMAFKISGLGPIRKFVCGSQPEKKENDPEKDKKKR